MGKAWLQSGLFPYVDLFDHKGVLIFFINGIASCLDPTGYRGLYILESFTMGGIFVILYNLSLDFLTDRRRALLAVLLFAALMGSGGIAARLTHSSPIAWNLFQSGGVAELYLLFLMALNFLAAWNCVKSGLNERKSALLFGVAAGCVVLIKFNIAVYVPFLFACMLLACRPGWRKSLRALFFMVAGFIAVCAPFIVVYALHGSLRNWWQCYIVYNALYNGTGMQSFFANLVALVLDATFFIVATLTGAAWFGWEMAASRGWKTRSLCALLMAACCAALYMASSGAPVRNMFIYYLLAPLLFFHFFLLLLVQGRFMTRNAGLFLALIGALLLLRESGPPKKFFADQEVMMRQMTERILAHAQGRPVRLLYYAGMENGLYRALDVNPPVFYFNHNNDLRMKERRSPSSIGKTQNRYIRDGLVDYVVVGGMQQEDGTIVPGNRNPDCLALMDELARCGKWSLLGEWTHRKEKVFLYARNIKNQRLPGTDADGKYRGEQNQIPSSVPRPGLQDSA